MSGKSKGRRYVAPRPQHPVISALITVLEDRDEISASGAQEVPEIFELLGGEGTPKSNRIGSAAYHLKTMVRRGIAKRTRTAEGRNGTPQKFYSLTDLGREAPADSLILDQIAAVLRREKPGEGTVASVVQLVEKSGREVSA